MSMTVLTTVPHQTLAVPIAAVLREHGIPAEVVSDDCGGLDPALAFTRGVEIRVPQERVAEARGILESIEAELGAD
jgi:hypothetical protein